MDLIEAPSFIRSAAAVGRRLLSLSWLVFGFGSVTMWAATARDCGPAALTVVAAQMRMNTGGICLLAEAFPPASGFSLAELRDLGVAAGLELVPVRRVGDGPLPSPSIARWRPGHFVALLAARDGEILFQDNAFRTPSGCRKRLSSVGAADTFSCRRSGCRRIGRASRTAKPGASVARA